MIVEIQLGTIEQAERASNDEAGGYRRSVGRSIVGPTGFDLTFNLVPIKLDRSACP